MDFGKTTLGNLTDPEPSYEWTRKRLVKSINDYIVGALTTNLSTPRFGVSGTIIFPPSAPIPYLYSPESGSSCGGIVSFVPGVATETEYDAVTAKTRNGDGSFWENYFEMFGRALFRSKLTIAPYLTITKNGSANAGFSTPYLYTSETLSSGNSHYLTIGNRFNLSKVIREWRDSGTSVDRRMRQGNFQTSEEVWSLVGTEVKRVATRTTYLWRWYTGEIKRTTDAYPGTFTGYIYGNLKFD